MVAAEIVRSLHAPLDLVLVQKIGAPLQIEYAVAAVSESGCLINSVCDEAWVQQQVPDKLKEMERRRALYLHGTAPCRFSDQLVFLVDDGMATGLTLHVGILELKHRGAQRIVVALGVAPKIQIDTLRPLVDEVVVLESAHEFQGSVGAYYEDFSQVSDAQVVAILNSFAY